MFAAKKSLLGNRNCIICNAPLSILDRASGALSTVAGGRCSICNTHYKAALAEFRSTFVQSGHSGTFTLMVWGGMWRQLQSIRVTQSPSLREDALRIIEHDIKAFLDRVITACYADGVFSAEEESYFNQMVRALVRDEVKAAPFRARWNHLRQFSEVRQGRLPVVNATFHLDSGEACHLATPASYQKITAKGPVAVEGQLVATSRRLHFISSDSSGWAIHYNRIMRTTLHGNAITLELMVNKGAGTYFVQNPEWVEAIISTLVRMEKRQLISGTSSSRSIPQDVKSAVFQRDGGRCVQCGAMDYLEYDHVIPFSKGGASSEGNVQLLCRRCNLTKSDKI